jgi:hypothetical protein
MKPITGQYECSQRSGVGLDYFTSRFHRLTLQASGRFVLIEQDKSRLAHAARSLLSGEQVTTNAPETRREGNYFQQGNSVSFRFDDGTQDQGQLAGNGEGIQIGTNFFEKVSDSTLLPPTHRMKQDMEDIAKGLKIAGAIGGAAIKAVKTIHDTLQTDSGSQGSQAGQSTSAPPTIQSHPASPPPADPAQPAQSSPQYSQGVVYCDQCGAPSRPGKRFCNRCGAPLT